MTRGKILEQLEKLEKMIDSMTPEEVVELVRKYEVRNSGQYALLEKMILSKDKEDAKAKISRGKTR